MTMQMGSLLRQWARRPLVWLHCLAVVLLATPAAYANFIKITFPNAAAAGSVTAGAGASRTTVNFAAGTSGDAIAALVAAGSGGVAMGNMVTYNGATGGGYVSTAGSLSGATVMRMVEPPVAPPPPPPKMMDIFGPAGGKVVIGKDGTITKTFFGSGINIIGSVSFTATDTIAQINARLLSTLDLQSSSLPTGFFFQAEPTGVSLVGPREFDIGLTDTITFATGGTVDVPLGAEYVPVPEPATLVMAGTAALAGLGYSWRRRRARATT